MCPDEKMSSRTPCLNGTFSNENKSVECKVCPAGYACPNSAQSPVECSTGYYSLERDPWCSICPAGHR